MRTFLPSTSTRQTKSSIVTILLLLLLWSNAIITLSLIIRNPGKSTQLSSNVNYYKQKSLLSIHNNNHHSSTHNNLKQRTLTSSSSCLSALPSPLFIKSAVSSVASNYNLNSVLLLRLALAVSTLVLVAAKSKPWILWPKSKPDLSVSEPLPPGSMGCPFLGTPLFFGTKEHGAGGFWRKRFASLKDSRLTKSYFLGMPVVAMFGASNIKPMLDSEFSASGVRSGSGSSNRTQELFGRESLFQAKDKTEHSVLRRLIGQAMTPSAITKAIPQLQVTANHQINLILKKQPEQVKMLDICTDFTLDVAWRQILGLNLNEVEVGTFRRAVKDWISGLSNPVMFILPTIRFTKAYKARKHLDSLLNRRIDQLRTEGPDGSTLSAMVHATDEEGQNQKLSHQQLLDNSLLLILAGSETAANTLTTAIMLLGLHPNVFHKIKLEQAQLLQKYDSQTAITKAQLDNECPYLDAFIKETMRMKPLAGGSIRIAADTLVYEGTQIPKSWPILFNIEETHYNDPKTYKEDLSHMDIKQGFIPERWLKSQTRPSTEYMPFGYGYRYCLGVNLAMAEMKIFVATFARNIDFDLLTVTTTDKMKWSKTSFIPIPEDGTVIKPRVSNFCEELVVAEPELTLA